MFNPFLFVICMSLSQINFDHILLFGFADKKCSDDYDLDKKLQVILNNTL